ncbi:MAG: hypothetical protein ACLQM6_13625, partial [Acidobacteriaceae bacterium]
FTGRTAYIYRIDGSGRKNEIPIEVKKILARKSPDVPLYANDMLYIPNSLGMRHHQPQYAAFWRQGRGAQVLLLVLCLYLPGIQPDGPFEPQVL